jgi:Flp pilus assembly protein protease CpaA
MWIALGSGVWVMACGFYDLRARRVPNWLTGLGLMGAALLRMHWIVMGPGSTAFAWLLTVSIWVLALTFWLAGWWGAADAKFVMVLSLAFPDPLMLLAMFKLNLVAGLCLRWTRKADLLLVKIPAVTILGAGWLGWAIFVLVGGS